jgi:hypothetical protein
METKDIGEQDPFERASLWIDDFLVPVFNNLAKDLKGERYQASISKQTDQELTLNFSKEGNRFEYTINCVESPTPIPNWPEGHIDLECSYRVNYVGGPVQFRDIEAQCDIEDVGEKEIEEHFRKTFRRWLSRR